MPSVAPRRKYDFAALRRADEATNFLAGLLMGGSRAFAQLVDAAVDVGAFLDVALADAVENHVGLLCGGGIVEIHERVSVDLLRQGGKVPAYALDIETARQGSVSQERTLEGSFELPW